MTYKPKSLEQPRPISAPQATCSPRYAILELPWFQRNNVSVSQTNKLENKNRPVKEYPSNVIKNNFHHTTFFKGKTKPSYGYNDLLGEKK